MKIDLSTNAKYNCQKFDSCNINKCPLDSDYLKLQTLPCDYSKLKKERCISRRRRFAIGSAFKLKNLGLTTREFSALKGKIGLAQDTPKFTQVQEIKTAKTDVLETNTKRMDDGKNGNMEKSNK